MKIAVIGSGISGLSVSRMLQDKGHEVVIYEKKSKPGGLIACDRINNCLFHKVGGHVFNSHNKQVLEWFWQYFDKEKEFVKVRRNAKVFLQNKLIGYPIENYLYMLDSGLVEKIVKELLLLQQQGKKSPFDYPHFEAFLRGNFGDTLYETYFGPYNHKIWRTDLSTVSMDWLEGKLPMPDYQNIILSNIQRKEEQDMVHSSFYYPLENGSQFIVDRLAENLTIRTDQEITEVTGNNNSYTIQNESGFEKIIWCGNIRVLPEAWSKELVSLGIDMNYIKQLHANGTSNLFCETDDTDTSWLYIPGSFTKAHRVIYTGNFSSTNNIGSKRKTCVVEFSGKVEYDTMVEEIKKLPGNLSPLAYNYESASYVVQDSKTRDAISAVKEILNAKGIYLIGRFAEWEYYNMDKCIEAAFKVVNDIENI